MKRIAAFLMSISLALTAAGCSSQIGQTKAPHEAEKLETPEQAAKAFCQAISDNDITTIKSLLAAPDIARSVDVNEMFKQLGYYDISLGLVEPTYETAIELNKQRLEGRFFMSLQYFYFGFFIDDILSTQEKVSFQKANLPFFKDTHMAKQIVKLMEAVDYESLSKLKVYDVIDTISLNNDASLKERIKNKYNYFGADECAEVTVIYQLEDDFYVGGLTLLQYEEGWKIYDLNNMEAGLFLGMVEPISKEMLDAIYETMKE